MPLGFAKSILTTAGAAGGSAARAFNDGQAVNAANKATYNIPVNGGFANNHRFSFVAWVRINGTSQLDSPGVRAMRFINGGDSGGGGWSWPLSYIFGGQQESSRHSRSSTPR